MNPGDFVRLVNNTGRTGVITPNGCSLRAGVTQCQVRFNDGALSWMRSEVLELVPSAPDADEDLLNGKTAGPEILRRTLLHEKLSGKLTGVLYSMEASDTRFLPYQFKPVLKIIESPCNSLLIADEVGLGKTIEAGLIWTELRARSGAQRLLVVCPAKLKQKWLNELSRRFGVRATDASAEDVLQNLQEYRRNGSHGFALVATYTSLRPPKDWEDQIPGSDPRISLAHFLNNAAQEEPLLDLLVVDEAHYMRNSETQAFKFGELSTDVAAYRVFLSATPLHTSNRNLYSLLRLLDPDTFNNEHAFTGIIEANAPLVRLRDTLARHDSTAKHALEEISAALENPYISDSATLANLRTELLKPEALSTMSRRASLAYQAERVNLLGHAFSRTRKRDVFSKEERVHRDVQSRIIDMTRMERDVYECICDLAVQFAESHNIPVGFLDVIPQRMVSSCVVAALQRWSGMLDGALWDSLEESYDSGPMIDYFKQRLHGRFDLEKLEREDSKFKLLIAELEKYWADYPGKKIIIFTTFHPTLKYLRRRLDTAGIRSLSILGGGSISPQDVVNLFAKEDSPRVLLSTEVGGEGLDMQFASALVNYDLPWNPMVVEQRIGRIDRIGQLERKIVILNLLQLGTIDERINDRLYLRLNLFRDSIGDLESVVGPEINKMQRALMGGHRLSAEQQDAIIRQAELAIEAEHQAKERLEESASVLAAYGDYLLNQIKAKHDQEQWVNAEEIENYVCNYISDQSPNVVLRGQDANERTYRIQLDLDTYAEFENFLQLNNLKGQTRICSAVEQTIRFDHRLYAKVPATVELVSQSHPLVRFVANQIRTHQLAMCLPVAITVNSGDASDIEPGIYLFNVQRWSVTGLRQIERLRFDVATTSGVQLDESLAERLTEDAGRHGKRWIGWDLILPPGTIHHALSAIDDLASDEFISFEDRCISENKDRARVQLTSIRRFQERREAVLNTLSARYSQEGKKALKAATEGQLAKLRERCVVQERRINEKSQVTAEYARICFGLINII